MKNKDFHKQTIAAVAANPEVKDLMAEACEAVKPAMEPEIERVASKAFLAVIRSPDLDKLFRAMALESAKDILAEEIAARLPEIESRIKAIVTEQIDGIVAQEVRARLDVAMREVRERFSKAMSAPSK